ncbi:Adaptive-response sensory-kinase SasA [subsurface metagenome]
MEKARIEKMLDVIMNVARGDYSSQVEVTEKNDELDSIAMGVNIMIDDIRNSVEEIERERDYINNIIKTITDMLIVVNTDATISTINKATKEILGYREDELIGKHIRIILAKEEEWMFGETGIEGLIKKGGISNTEITYLNKEGKKIPLLFSGSILRDRKGNILGAVCVANDIAERKKVEEVLKERVKELQCLYSIAEISEKPEITLDELYQEAAYLLPPSWQYPEITCSRIIIKDKSYESDNFRKTKWIQKANISIKTQVIGTVEVYYLEEKPDIYEGPFLKEERYLINAVAKQLGEYTGRINSKKSIKKLNTDLKMTIKELNRSNQELEQFAYISSHDLQEPLRKVLVFGERLKTKYAEKLDERGKDYIERMQSSTNRMQTMINKLLEYSRVTKRANLFSQVDLNDIVQTTLSDLEISIKKANAQIKVEDLPVIDADKIQMSQLFANLIGNAIKFHKEETEPIIKIYSKKENKEYRVFIEDNGIGFDEQYLGKIFQPFQRLHGIGKFEGTGLGLSICLKIVEIHNGTITAKSKIGKGSTFIVTFPVKSDNN